MSGKIQDQWENVLARLSDELSTTSHPYGPFLYATSPGDGATKYVFQDHVCLGMREAITYAESLLNKDK